MWCERAQFRSLALKQSRNRFDQPWERGTLSDTTRGTQGHDPLHPALALLALGPLAAFVPPDLSFRQARLTSRHGSVKADLTCQRPMLDPL